MKVIWSPLAVDQVRKIASYTALDKPGAAIAWAEEIFESVERLAEFPESGRYVPEINRNNIREIVLNNYRVIYKIMDDEIRILVVKSYRQKLHKDEL